MQSVIEKPQLPVASRRRRGGARSSAKEIALLLEMAEM